MSPVRIKRLAAELQMRRRRLNAYRWSDPWPGKDIAWRTEQIRYDQYLVLAAQMLELPTPELAAGVTLASDLRALLEDRLAQAGLDVFAPRNGITGDVLRDGDLWI